MRLARLALPLAGAIVSTLLLGTPSAQAAPRQPGNPGHPGLPDDAPAALYRSEPTLPPAKGWPAPNDAFPLTSGTGRLAGGAYYWTDYLYDDHGGTTASTGDPSVTAGSPSFGTYRYPFGWKYHHNAADIFRAAVALRPKASYWRVDWNTLTRRTVPLAVWTFDRDHSTSTGVSAWPGGAGVSSPGIDTALIVSSHGARLIDLASGRTVRTLPTTVTPQAHSFVVRVPRTLLKVSGTWRIRLASGLANADGTGFARPPGTTPAQAAIYNVTFRSRLQEKPADNFWDDMAQTVALDAGSVAKFSTLVAWSRLAHRTHTPQPTPSGWNDRWYVSAVDLGNGIEVDPSSIQDGEANYLGRVQPYAVYVPTHVARSARLPVTFLLHSSTQNHNQYAATTPKLVANACERRRSLCVSILGRGPDGNYFGPAELDFWQVWHAASQTFRLDPERTVLLGYSLGGEGTNQLAMEHPDLFGRAITLAGAIGDTPSLTNLRWVPTYLAGGAADELVPLPVERAEADRLQALGYRYRWVVVSGVDHVAFELCDCFDDAVAYIGDGRRVTRPAAFTFHWHPADGHLDNGVGPDLSAVYWTQRPDLGIGTTGAYWVRQLTARSTRTDAEIDARSTLLPGRVVTTHANQGIDPDVQPAPSLATEQTWTLGAATPRGRDIHLTLTNVASLRLLTRMAGLRPGAHATLHVTTDGPMTITVGKRAIRLTRGNHTVRL